MKQYQEQQSVDEKPEVRDRSQKFLPVQQKKKSEKQATKLQTNEVTQVGLHAVYKHYHIIRLL
jgi:hypothetical protein